MKLINIFAIFVGFALAKEKPADLPCAAKFYDQSSVCICNSTYCDTITRTVPRPGTFMIYTSSKAGLRLQKKTGYIKILDQIFNDDKYSKVYEILPTAIHQTIEGFGGAVTDAAGINWKSLPLEVQEHLINSYFSDVGIEFNMLRLPIASTDFSTRVYTYHDQEEYDMSLSNFTLALEDYKFRIPFVHAAKEVATDVIKIVSASWSPPAWMKEPKQVAGGGRVKEEYFEVFADYHCKFAEAYKNNGIDIWAMSPSNEPLNTLMGSKYQATIWGTSDMATFVAKYFGPTLKECSVKGIKILTGDDQRSSIPMFFSMLANADPSALNFIDGIAVHSYLNKIVAPSVITLALEHFPDKFAINTEYSSGSKAPDKLKVVLGSWDRAKDYFEDIIENLNSNFVGWIDWNLCLNTEGGPSWIKGFVDSAIIVDAVKQEFYKQPVFYALAHFSKFVPRGSKRIKIVAFEEDALNSLDENCKTEPSKEYVAFLTPRKTIVVIIHNDRICSELCYKTSEKELKMLKRTHVEGEVSSATATGLRVLRLFGLAPLRITRVRDGVYHIRYSCIIFILSTTIILLTNITILYFYLYTLWHDTDKNTAVSNLVKVSRHTALVIPIITLTSLAICTTSRRMDNLLYILNQIQKIRGKIIYDCKLDPTSWDVIVTSLGLFFLSIVLYILDLILADPSENIFYGTIDYNTTMFFKAAVHIDHCIILALQLQYLFLVTILRSTIKALNWKLTQLNFYEDTDCLRITPRSNYVRNLTRSYLSIYEVMIKLTQADGLFLIMLLCTCLTRMLVATYCLWFVYKKITSSHHFVQNVYLQVYGLIMKSIYVLLLIEPFHRLNNEIENTNEVISSLLGTLPRNSVLHSELDILNDLLLLQPSVTPLGLFQFNRSLIVIIIGYVVTFLLISNQFQH